MRWTIFVFLFTLGNLTSFFIVGLEVLVSTWPQPTQLSSTTLTGILTTISRLSPEHTESVKRTRLVATKHWIYSTHYQLTETSSQLIQGLYHYQIKFYPVFKMLDISYSKLNSMFDEICYNWFEFVTQHSACITLPGENVGFCYCKSNAL